jgi:ribosome-associated translation inhibitor RaiA
MQIPLQITFRGMDPSPAIESLIRQRSARIARFNDRIIRCHVVVDVPHQRSRKGNPYAVHLDITTPTGPIVISRDPGVEEAHVEAGVAVRDAFDAATRRLEDEARRHRPA